MSSRAAHFDLAGIIALEGRGLQLSAVSVLKYQRLACVAACKHADHMCCS